MPETAVPAGPGFSVVITSFNQKTFIRDAVDSALALRRAPAEIIVVDDASSDGSQEVLRAYGSAIRLVALTANAGKGGARNRGAVLATGDYLVFLDGDDVLLPWALEVYGRVAAAKAPALILAPMLWFSEELRSMNLPEEPRTIEIVEYEDYFRKDRAFGVSASSVVVRRDAFERVSGWADMPVMQDQEFVIRLGVAGRTVHVLSPRTIGHRAHDGQTVHHVPPFIDAMYALMRSERAGKFPGGTRRRRDRAAILGALAFFWTKRALKARLYWTAVKLLASTWPLQLTASVRRLRAIVAGRRQPEEIAL